jgi:TonB family protein
MAEVNNDIEKYLRGELTPAEMHALEQRALQDPFLAEALEGAEHAGVENFSIDIAMLRQSIHEKSKQKKRKIIALNEWGLYSGIAAGLVLLAVSTYVIFLSINQLNESKIAQANDSNADIQQYLADQATADTLDIPAAPEEYKRQERKPQRSVASRKRRSADLAQGEGPISNATLAQPSSRGIQSSAEPVSNEAYISKKENEREVLAELSEPPVVMKDGVDTKDQTTETKKEALTDDRQKAQLSVAPTKNHVPRSIKGKVVAAEDENPIPGVNVIVKGTNIATLTDVKGNYEITLPGPESTLTFAFIGYASEEVPAIDKSEIIVRMNEDVTALSEVVVVGYGTSANEPGSEPAETIFEMAEPVGGHRYFKKYLEEKQRYPEEAFEQNIEGRVTVQFTVEPDGSLSDFKIVKGLGYGCDDELIRLIKEGPAWTPSKSNSRPVKEKVKVRLKFEKPDK